MKHQTSCYRNINGRRYENLADLVYSEEENNLIISQAKKKGRSVRRIKHPEGFYQLFVEVEHE